MVLTISTRFISNIAHLFKSNLNNSDRYCLYPCPLFLLRLSAPSIQRHPAGEDKHEDGEADWKEVARNTIHTTQSVVGAKVTTKLVPESQWPFLVALTHSGLELGKADESLLLGLRVGRLFLFLLLALVFVFVCKVDCDGQLHQRGGDEEDAHDVPHLQRVDVRHVQVDLDLLRDHRQQTRDAQRGARRRHHRRNPKADERHRHDHYRGHKLFDDIVADVALHHNLAKEVRVAEICRGQGDLLKLSKIYGKTY